MFAREYATGFRAVVMIAHLPALRDYPATYLSVASDGEPVRGTMTFRYTDSVTAAPPGWQPPNAPPEPAPDRLNPGRAVRRSGRRYDRVNNRAVVVAGA